MHTDLSEEEIAARIAEANQPVTLPSFRIEQLKSKLEKARSARNAWRKRAETAENALHNIESEGQRFYRNAAEKRYQDRIAMLETARQKANSGVLERFMSLLAEKLV